MREANISSKVVRFARGQRLIAIKLTMMGQYGTMGWPDYQFLGPNAKIVFIEFKVPGNRLTQIQSVAQEELRAFDFTVYTVFDASEGINILKREFAL